MKRFFRGECSDQTAVHFSSQNTMNALRDFKWQNLLRHLTWQQFREDVMDRLGRTSFLELSICSYGGVQLEAGRKLFPGHLQYRTKLPREHSSTCRRAAAGTGGMINQRNPSFTQGKECGALCLKQNTAWSIERVHRDYAEWVNKQMSAEEKIKGTAGQERKTTACKKEKYTLKGKKGQESRVSWWVKEVGKTGQESKVLQR